MSVKNESLLEETPKPANCETPRSNRSASAIKKGHTSKREYFSNELERLRLSLKRDRSMIREPPSREYCPNTFNSLGPYFCLEIANSLINEPQTIRHAHSSRPMAHGMLNPWDDLAMDLSLLPRIDHGFGTTASTRREIKARRPSASVLGSTRLPKFPSVDIQTAELTKKRLYYSDVPMLREELKNKYSSTAKNKINAEYTRTKDDFKRMELDRLNEYHPITIPNMRATYFAYLQNNAGSRKAIYECVKLLEKETKSKIQPIK